MFRGQKKKASGTADRRTLVLCRSRGHRLFLIFGASSVCASARQRTIAAANAANALGVAAVTEGFAGQTTMKKLGWSSGNNAVPR